MTSVTLKKKPFSLLQELTIPYVIESECPECGEPNELDLENDGGGLFRTKLNKPDEVWEFCCMCEKEYAIPIKLSINLEVL